MAMTVLEKRFMEMVPDTLRDISRSLEAIAMGCKQAAAPESKDDGYFVITRVHRDDLEAAGFDASGVDDATMERLAGKMASDYLHQLYWVQLPIIAESLDIPRKGEKDEE